MIVSNIQNVYRYNNSSQTKKVSKFDHPDTFVKSVGLNTPSFCGVLSPAAETKLIKSIEDIANQSPIHKEYPCKIIKLNNQIFQCKMPDLSTCDSTSITKGFKKLGIKDIFFIGDEGAFIRNFRKLYENKPKINMQLVVPVGAQLPSHLRYEADPRAYFNDKTFNDVLNTNRVLITCPTGIQNSKLFAGILMYRKLNYSMEEVRNILGIDHKLSNTILDLNERITREAAQNGNLATFRNMNKGS